MTPDEYGFRVGAGLQTAFSDVLMGMREQRANQELSLREKSYNLENQLKGLQIQDASETLDLNHAKASGYNQTSQQFGGLQTMALKGDVDGLLKANYTPIELPGFSKLAQDRLNSENEANFRAMKTEALTKSSVYQTRMGHIEALAEYGTQLADKPLDRELVAETQTQLQQGIPITQLPPEKIALLNDAVQYKSRRALMSNPTVAASVLRNESAQKVAQINAAGRMGVANIRANSGAMKDNVATTQRVMINLGAQKTQALANQQMSTAERQKVVAEIDAKYEKAEKAYNAALTLSNLAGSGKLTIAQAQKTMAGVGLPKDTMTTVTVKNKYGDNQTFQIPFDMLDALQQNMEQHEAELMDLQIDMGDDQSQPE
jgi:hypothetical protein